MNTRRKLSARAAAVLVATFMAVTMMPGSANAVGTNTLKATSTMTALGQTFTLNNDCVNFINDAATPLPTCSTFTGTPNVTVTAKTTLAGTLNTVGSTITVASGFKVTLSTGPCELIINNPKTLTYATTPLPASYKLTSTVGAYSFGSCPAFWQAVVNMQLGTNPSGAAFGASWIVS